MATESKIFTDEVMAKGRTLIDGLNAIEVRLAARQLCGRDALNALSTLGGKPLSCDDLVDFGVYSEGRVCSVMSASIKGGRVMLHLEDCETGSADEVRLEELDYLSDICAVTKRITEGW